MKTISSKETVFMIWFEFSVRGDNCDYMIVKLGFYVSKFQNNVLYRLYLNGNWS